MLLVKYYISAGFKNKIAFLRNYIDYFFVIQVTFHCGMEFILNILNYCVWYYSVTRLLFFKLIFIKFG